MDLKQILIIKGKKGNKKKSKVSDVPHWHSNFFPQWHGKDIIKATQLVESILIFMLILWENIHKISSEIENVPKDYTPIIKKLPASPIFAIKAHHQQSSAVA